MGPRLTALRTLQDSIVARQSKKTAHNKAQLEKPADSVGLRWHGIDLGHGLVPKGG